MVLHWQILADPLSPAGGLHLGLLPLFGALIGGEVTLTKPNTIDIHHCCSPSILTPSSGSLQPVQWNQSDHADGRGEIAA